MSVETEKDGFQGELFPSYLDYRKVEKRIAFDILENGLTPAEYERVWEVGLEVFTNRKKREENAKHGNSLLPRNNRGDADSTTGPDIAR